MQSITHFVFVDIWQASGSAPKHGLAWKYVTTSERQYLYNDFSMPLEWVFMNH